jgi:hypothetical protein
MTVSAKVEESTVAEFTPVPVLTASAARKGARAKSIDRRIMRRILSPLFLRNLPGDCFSMLCSLNAAPAQALPGTLLYQAYAACHRRVPETLWRSFILPAPTLFCRPIQPMKKSFPFSSGHPNPARSYRSRVL